MERETCLVGVDGNVRKLIFIQHCHPSTGEVREYIDEWKRIVEGSL